MRPELSPFLAEVSRLLPVDAHVCDAHAHLGTDDDGSTMSAERLLRQLDEAGIERACVFAMNAPTRAPAFTGPNDHVFAASATSDGRLIPFCRVDPGDGAVAEAERCLARGARGIKLHPRHQPFIPEVVTGVFALAADAGVPILVHAGRGMGPISDTLCDIALAHTGAPLILAHAAMADQGTFIERLADHPRAFYDTSAFRPLDVISLVGRVPPGRIVFGSDPPYGRPLLGLFLTVRAAAAIGPDALRGVLGGTIQAVLDGGHEVSDESDRRFRVHSIAPGLARFAEYLSSAFAALRRGATRAAGDDLDLALAVCRDPDPGVGAGEVLHVLRPVVETVRTAVITPGARVPADALYLAMVYAATEPPWDGR